MGTGKTEKLIKGLVSRLKLSKHMEFIQKINHIIEYFNCPETSLSLAQ